MQFKCQDQSENSNQYKRQQKQQKSTKRPSQILGIDSKVYNQKLNDSKFQNGIDQSCQTDVEVQFYVGYRKQTNVMVISKRQNVESKESQQKQQPKHQHQHQQQQKQQLKQIPNSKNQNKKQQKFDQKPKRQGSKNKSQQFYPIPQPYIIAPHLLSKPQLKYRQLVKQKIIQSKYPQNVMKRVYPFSVQHKQQEKEKEQQDDFFSQSIYKRQEMKRYEHVQWSRCEYKVLVGNLKWMALSLFYLQFRKRVKQQQQQQQDINSDNNNSNSNEYIDIDKHNDPDRHLQPQVNKQLSLMITKIKNQNQNQSSLIQTQQQITQHILQLKCLLRYRHVQQIFLELGQIVQSYYEHSELFGLEDVFDEKDVLYIIGKDNQWFFNLVMEMFVKLIVKIVSQYQYVSDSNKQYIQKVFQDRQEGSQIKKYRQQQDLSIMLENQRIFQPYKKLLKAIKYNRPLNQTTHPIATQRQFRKNQMNKKDNENHEIQI